MESRSNIIWGDYSQHLKSVFNNLLKNSDFVDVTLCCEGKKFQAHKIILSACSTHFRDLLKDVQNIHPIIVLYGIEYDIMMKILHFIYNGDVSIEKDRLETFLATAHLLQIEGLLDVPSENTSSNMNEIIPKEEVDVDLKETSRAATKRKASVRAKQRPKRIHVKTESETGIYAEPIDEPTDDLTQQIEIKSENGDSDAATQVVEDLRLDYTTLQDQLQFTEEQSAFSKDSRTCEVCKKVFDHPYSLNHHRAVHKGKTQCPVCDAVLSRKYNLKMHLKARHNITT